MESKINYPYFRAVAFSASSKQAPTANTDSEELGYQIAQTVLDLAEELRTNVRFYSSLRQCTKLSEIYLTPSFWYAKQMLQGSIPKVNSSWGRSALAMWCRCLPEVRAVSTNNFISDLASASKGDQPLVSEMRFRQLLCAPNEEIFLTQLIGCIRLINGEINPSSLLDSIFLWCRDNCENAPIQLTARQTANYIWSNEFYSKRS